MIGYLFSGEKYNPLMNKGQYKSFVLKNSELKLQKEYNSSIITSANVVALIEGSDPVLKNEYITLGAHLDHLGIHHGEIMNGADDNASGSIGVLEIAEALAMSKPKRSVICILFTGEELGLLGSYYFTENSPVLLKDIIANINLDMLGCSNTDVKGLAPIGAGRITPKLKELILNVNDEKQYVPLDWAYADTTHFINSSDHYPFHLKKIPAVFFFSGENADLHMPTDDADKIDYDFFQRSCRFVYEVIMKLANSDGNLKE
jgi:Zn-dependent M28 family amino/carboxypeptidase